MSLHATGVAHAWETASGVDQPARAILHAAITADEKSSIAALAFKTNAAASAAHVPRQSK